MAHKFGELRLTSKANLNALNIGEIERRFFAKCPATATFRLAKKVW
jgi:hypothetical protein